MPCTGSGGGPFETWGRAEITGDGMFRLESPGVCETDTAGAAGAGVFDSTATFGGMDVRAAGARDAFGGLEVRAAGVRDVFGGMDVRAAGAREVFGGLEVRAGGVREVFGGMDVRAAGAREAFGGMDVRAAGAREALGRIEARERGAADFRSAGSGAGALAAGLGGDAAFLVGDPVGSGVAAFGASERRVPCVAGRGGFCFCFASGGIERRAPAARGPGEREGRLG